VVGIAELPPNFAVVYPVDGGFEVEPARRQTWSERLFGAGRNRPCHVVDLGDHWRTAELTRTPLPCRDQAHRFEARLDIGFRVHDPALVVRHNVTNALNPVYRRLTKDLRDHAAQFQINEAQHAQTHINSAFARDIALPEGITIFHCVVQLEPDAAAREFIKGLKRIERDRMLGGQDHTREVGNAHHQVAIDDIHHAAQLRREREQRETHGHLLGSLPTQVRGLVEVHLSKHPGDTARVMDLLLALEQTRTARQDNREEQEREMLRFLVERGVVRDVDLPGLRAEALGQQARAALGPDPSAVRTAAPTPPAAEAEPGPAPVMWGAHPTGPGPERPSEAGPARLAPVYVVLDASPAAARCLRELTSALRSLQTALVQAPDTAAAVRLAALTYADTADLLLPLAPVTWETSIPEPRPGPAARLSSAFERLLELVPADTERLKQEARVARPTVFLVTAGTPEDGDRWPGLHQRLAEHAYHPHLIACGIGGTDPDVIGRLASRPGMGFVARTGDDAAASAEQFAVLLQNAVLSLGRTARAGSGELRLVRPEGLVPVESLTREIADLES
jgi:uncharacterized protein YegL